jgi:hypothetical protein
MDEAILPPDDPQPKHRGATRTAWIRRQPPDDPIERIFFLLDRIDRVYSLHIMKDLEQLYHAAHAAQPGPGTLRQIGKEIANARGTAGITRVLLRELWTTVAQEPSRRKWVTKRRADETWLRQQLGTLEGPK